MAVKSYSGQPFVGYVSLTTTAAANIAMFPIMGGAAYTLKANERVMITNITVSSNDTSPGLLTIDTNAVGTPTKLVSAYVSSTQPLQPEQIPTGICMGVNGTPIRAVVSAITATKTVEIVLKGCIVSS